MTIPLWFVVFLLLLVRWKPKEDRWLDEKRRQAIRELMEEERRLIEAEENERWKDYTLDNPALRRRAFPVIVILLGVLMYLVIFQPY